MFNFEARTDVLYFPTKWKPDTYNNPDQLAVLPPAPPYPPCNTYTDGWIGRPRALRFKGHRPPELVSCPTWMLATEGGHSLMLHVSPPLLGPPFPPFRGSLLPVSPEEDFP